MGTHSRVGSHKVRYDGWFFVEHGYLEVPSLVQWMATLKCGLRCEHCLAISHVGGFDDMPLEKTRALIDEVAALGVREFLLTGGEPLAREDLGEVIEYLGRRGVSWTLNTATLPEGNLREVIVRNPPGFVAVSLDGPREIHDKFRGQAGAWEAALESIRFFKSLAGVRVCAGTTVTRRNYDYLDETFHLVAAGGADQWGIHLLVPEGRAAERRDLFLTRPQLKRLIKFVARKRRYFRVEMADEIGYLGYLEPLVRDVPLTCGAGRSQCVILPDGAVVPCTTLDRSCSAGNIHERPLSRIWAEGFQALRSWCPAGKCERCEYSTACRGGCWLQRKAGTQCFKDVWHVPGALKTAAGIAICLGGLAASDPAQTADAEPLFVADSATPESLVAEEEMALAPAVAEGMSLDEAIMGYYTYQAAGCTPPSSWPGIDPNEPAWKFLLDFTGDTLPQDMLERCAAVISALQTQERSLSLAGLLWRAVSEPLFDPNNPTVYSESERQVIRDTLAAISLQAQEWRLEVFEQSLDPYLSNGRKTYPQCVAGKARGFVFCWYDTQYYLSRDLNEERWGVGTSPDSREAAQIYLADHHYADQMDLTFRFSVPRYSGADLPGATLLRYRGGEPQVVSYVPGSGGMSPETIGPFDVIQTPQKVVLTFEILGNTRIESRYDIESTSYDPNRTNLLDDRDNRGTGGLSTTLWVSLEAGREYTYVELLNVVYQQYQDALRAMAYEWIAGDYVPLWNQGVYVTAAVHQNGVLLWPAIRDIIRSHSPTGAPAEDPAPEPGLPLSPDQYRRAVVKDIDFWMF